MVRSRLGLKALGLCALVMGVMAIGTTGVAQAEVGSCWGYINPTTGVLSCFNASLEGTLATTIENKTGTLLIANQNFTILCTEMAIVEGGKLGANGGVSSGRIKFSGCVTLIKGVISKPCEPNDPTTGKGTVRTEKEHGLIVLHELKPSGEKDPVVLVLPDSGETLAKIFLGEECSVGAEVIVKGHLVLWDCKGNASFKTHAEVHLLEEFPGLKLMKVGANSATLDGSANALLVSPHLDWKWAGLAA